MAAPTNLLELAQANESAASAELSAARSAVQAAQTAAGAAKAMFEQSLAQRIVAEKEVAQVRKQLSEAETEADASAAAVELGNKLLALREKSAKALEAEAALASATSAAEAAGGKLARASAALAAAKSALTEADGAAKRRAAAEDALTRPPLSTLVADAKKLKNTAPNNKPYKDAKARIEADIPTKLIERARERRAALLAQGQRVAALIDAAAEGKWNALGAVEAAKAKHARMQAVLSDFIANAPNRLDRAKALLAKIADPQQSALTAAQKTAIAGAAAKGDPAAGEEKKRDDAVAKLATAQAALDAALLKAKLADMDKAAALDADPSSDPTLAPLVTARDQARGELQTAEAAFTPTLRADLKAWETAVPDDTWNLLADFEEASEILTALGMADPAQWKTDRDAAEKALVDVRLAAVKSTRAHRLAESELARLHAAFRFESENRSRRLIVALRGDR